MRYALLGAVAAALVAIAPAEAVHAPPGCRRVPAGGATFSAWPTGGGRTLVALPCLVGAYQGTWALFLVRPGHRTLGPLPLVTYRDPGTGRPRVVRETRILGTLTFRNGTLTVLDKFRGVGDCGIRSRFRLVGTRFRTIEVRAKTACDGKPPFDSRRWPRLRTPRS